jgi:hypothetical protein
MQYEYKRITSPQELPTDKIVYQWDSGWWYDWDLSDYSDCELEKLFSGNIIYVKVEENV